MDSFVREESCCFWIFYVFYTFEKETSFVAPARKISNTQRLSVTKLEKDISDSFQKNHWLQIMLSNIHMYQVRLDQIDNLFWTVESLEKQHFTVKFYRMSQIHQSRDLYLEELSESTAIITVIWVPIIPNFEFLPTWLWGGLNVSKIAPSLNNFACPNLEKENLHIIFPDENCMFSSCYEACKQPDDEHQCCSRKTVAQPGLTK